MRRFGETITFGEIRINPNRLVKYFGRKRGSAYQTETIPWPMLDQQFSSRLKKRQESAQSLLCVGLDPDIDRFPAHLKAENDTESAIVAFNRAIIEATAQFACAYKLNFAFFERHGVPGWKALERTLEFIPNDVLTIADGKRGDIGNTAGFYAASVFDTLGFDACTVAPYMGVDAVEPFLSRSGKCAFILCRTSNKSADDFQLFSDGQRSLFETVATTAADWSSRFAGEPGLVVGATRPQDLARVRSLAPALPFLIPGVGAQGGDAGEAVRSSMTADGPIIVNSSRSILYAGNGQDFAEQAADAANALRLLLQP